MLTVVPRGSSYDFNSKKPFSISRSIPLIGEIGGEGVMTVNLPAPESHKRVESFEERQDNLREFREDEDTM